MEVSESQLMSASPLLKSAQMSIPSANTSAGKPTPPPAEPPPTAPTTPYMYAACAGCGAFFELDADEDEVEWPEVRESCSSGHTKSRSTCPQVGSFGSNGCRWPTFCTRAEIQMVISKITKELNIVSRNIIQSECRF